MANGLGLVIRRKDFFPDRSVIGVSREANLTWLLRSLNQALEANKNA